MMIRMPFTSTVGMSKLCFLFRDLTLRVHRLRESGVLYFSLVMAAGISPGCVLYAAPPAHPLTGRWDIVITTPHGELPSWIEISEDDLHPQILMVGVTDHANSLQDFRLHGSEIQFVSPKGEEGFPHDLQFKGKLVGGEIHGIVNGAPGEEWRWVGFRAPALKRKILPHWGKPRKLFNGTDFTGWRFLDPAKAGRWIVNNGELVSTGLGSELISNENFEDFKLHVEFKCSPSSNSGVYLRGRYEVQIETDSWFKPGDRHTGAIYGFLAPTPEQPRRSDVWQTFDITLVGRIVTVAQNGIIAIDHREIPGITGGALDSHEGSAGPIYLQGSEEGVVEFRNIVVTPAGKLAQPTH
jgi:hypothetical protein